MTEVDTGGWVDLELSFVAFVPLEIPKNAYPPLIGLIYVLWAVFGAFPSR